MFEIRLDNARAHRKIVADCAKDSYDKLILDKISNYSRLLLKLEIPQINILSRTDKTINDKEELEADEGFMKFYCDSNLKNKIKTEHLDTNGQKKNEITLKSEVSSGRQDSEPSAEYRKEKVGFWGKIDFAEVGDDHETSFSTVTGQKSEHEDQSSRGIVSPEADNTHPDFQDHQSRGSGSRDKTLSHSRSLVHGVTGAEEFINSSIVNKEKKRKKRKQLNYKVLGVDAASKRLELDQFGHLKQSKGDITKHKAMEETVKFMKKMGVSIPYQKETHGQNLKSALKQLGAKSRDLRVRLNLQGLDVKDENTARRLKEKEKEKFGQAFTSLTNKDPNTFQSGETPLTVDIPQSNSDLYSVQAPILNSPVLFKKVVNNDENGITDLILRREVSISSGKGGILANDIDSMQDDKPYIDNAVKLRQFLLSHYPSTSRRSQSSAAATSSAETKNEASYSRSRLGSTEMSFSRFESGVFNSLKNKKLEEERKQRTNDLNNLKELSKRKLEILKEEVSTREFEDYQSRHQPNSLGLKNENAFFIEIATNEEKYAKPLRFDYDVDQLVKRYQELHPKKTPREGNTIGSRTESPPNPISGVKDRRSKLNISSIIGVSGQNKKVGP
jgi:hypothetical protein